MNRAFPLLPACLWLLLCASPCRSAEIPPLAPLNFNGVYSFGWNGLPFGEMALKTTEGAGRYTAESRVGFTGLAGLLNSHKSTAQGSGGTEGGVMRTARVYETFYSTRKKAKHVKLTFAQGGRLAEAVLEPPNNKDKRPDVPAEAVHGAPDPLSYMFALREALHGALQKGESSFSLPLFDGRRLMETQFRIVATHVAPQKSGGPLLTEVIGTRKALAGFSQKELDDMKGEPELHAWFTEDAQMIPQTLQFQVMLGRVTAKLARRCEGAELCGGGKDKGK